MLKPTSYLTFTLAGDAATGAMASAVKRTYSYIAPTTIVRDDAPGAPCWVQLQVKLPSHPYLQAGAESQRTWDEIVAPWLRFKLETLFGSMSEFNNESRKSFTGRIEYAYLVIALEDQPVRIELDPEPTLSSTIDVLHACRKRIIGSSQATAE